MEATKVVTIISMIDLGTVPSTEQVWLVPGTSDDFEDGGEYCGWFIEDYLKARGVLLGANLNSSATSTLIEDVKHKFEKSGIKVVLETTAND